MLADVFREAGQPLRAIPHLVASGQQRKLKAAANALPDEPILFAASGLGRQQWERACAYTVVAAAADLIPDSEARDWVSATLAEISADEPVPFLTPSPVLAAWEAFAAVAALSTETEAREFLSIAEPLVAREPNRYRHTDDAHIDALVALSATHGPIRSAAVRQLCDLLVADSSMAGRVLARGSDTLKAAPDVVAERCTDAAASGNVNAARALITAGMGAQVVEPLAEKALHAVAQPRVHQPGRREYQGGWAGDAVFVRILGPAAAATFGEAMCAIALDHDDVAHNRQRSLEALIPIADALAEGPRTACFTVALDAARGTLDGSADDGMFSAGPLDRWRINFGPASLRLGGVRAAAALARGAHQQDVISGVALECLAGVTDDVASSIVQALSWLPAATSIDVRVLAAHPYPSVRAFAAYAWCTTGGTPPEVGSALARDTSPRVRGTLADHLGDGPLFDALRKTLEKDVRRSVRTIATGSSTKP
jgi:hypothetical protein